MKHNILGVSNAAEILGVDENTVFCWCKNRIINCKDAPADYSDKTKYLIDEDECDYIRGLILKFGARKALLNYNKNWRGNAGGEEKKKEVFDSNIPWILDMDIPTESGEPVKSSAPIKESKNENKDDELVSSILNAHSLKCKISELKNELSRLETEYEEIKQEIMAQI